MNYNDFMNIIKMFRLMIEINEKCYIQYTSNDTVLIEGKIPLKVALNIYNNYKKYRKNIRINGEKKQSNPLDFAKEEKINDYLKQINYYFNNNKDELENKYIEKYEIDTKEGLIIFLFEMKKYLNNNFKDNLDDIMANINYNIIKNGDLSVSLYEWMKKIDLSYKNKLISPFNDLVRNKIDELDNIINPFINRNINYDDVKNFQNKISIETYLYDEYNENVQLIKNCSKTKIQDNKNNYVTFSRDSKGFNYQVFYKLSDERFYSYKHYFVSNQELINFIYFGGKSKKINIIYNLSNKKFKSSFTNGKKNISNEQILLLYNELLNALDYASDITINNIKKEKTKIK